MSSADPYQKLGTLDETSFITDPSVPDPDNLPIPLGWNIMVRPYPIEAATKGGIILSPTDVDFMNFTTNIGRVVAVGNSCWNRSQHHNTDGDYCAWARVGDFVSYPRHKGAMRKFKGVTYVMLSDDDLMEALPDPLVFDIDSMYDLNIPQEDLEKYNTIHNPDGYQAIGSE